MQAILSFLSFSGRSGRKSFTLAWVFLYTVLCACLFFFQTFKAYGLWFFIGYITLLIAFWPLTVRRLHDISFCGCYAAIPMVSAAIGAVAFMPLFAENWLFLKELQFLSWITLVMVAYLAIKRGMHGPNDYGDDPRWDEAPRVQLDEFLSWCETDDGKKVKDTADE